MAAEQRSPELDLVDAVIAAHHDELPLIAVDDHRIGLQQRAGRNLERRATASIVVIPGVWTSTGAGSGAGSSTGWASAAATSTLAA